MLAALVLAVLVGAVGAWALTGGGGGGESGAGPRPWRQPELGNSQRLANRAGSVCSTTLSQELFCVDAATGADQLRLELDEGESGGAPVLVDDRLVVASSELQRGFVRAYSLDGDQLWVESAYVRMDSEIAEAGGVVAAIDRDELVGLDAATGDELWTRYGGGDIGDAEPIGSVFGAADHLHVALRHWDGGESVVHVVAVDPVSGDEVWRSPVLPGRDSVSGIRALGAFDDGATVAVLLPGDPDSVVVLDTATGQVRWERAMAADYNSVAHVDGVTVVADGPDMRGLAADGTELWHAPAPVLENNPSLVGPGDLVVTDGRLFVAGFDVYEVDPADGSSVLVREGVDAVDVEIVGDHIVMAGRGELRAVLVSELDD